MILLQLLWSFTKIGFTSFGGLSMIPLISSEMQVHQWMTAEEVSDIVAIAEMTPGPLGLNCATFAGIRRFAWRHRRQSGGADAYLDRVCSGRPVFPALPQ